jgi:hypothetical protein
VKQFAVPTGLRWELALLLWLFAFSTARGQVFEPLSALTEPRDYAQKRASSYDRSGGNDDYRTIAAGETLTMLDEAGPGVITHVWITLASDEAFHLKKLVLRMYWDGEATPSVETPLGDFFGLGLGDYYSFESAPLSVAPDHALNAFFPMPFARHARITVTNTGEMKVDAFYFNVDYQAYARALPGRPLYFHAEYRQAAPNRGLGSGWTDNADPRVTQRKNTTGEGNYVWLEATGRGHFVGVTMSVLQNQDSWWGEGDDMFCIDGVTEPSIFGTGSEDYFLGAYNFGGRPFSYSLYGAPVVGAERAGSRSSVYRFHLDSPIPFARSIRATVEHGHANARSDSYYSVAYWYQAEPHAPFPALPAVADRLPRLDAVGGPGNAGR